MPDVKFAQVRFSIDGSGESEWYVAKVCRSSDGTSLLIEGALYAPQELFQVEVVARVCVSKKNGKSATESRAALSPNPDEYNTEISNSGYSLNQQKIA
jgi:hypothetical protein